MPSLSSIGRFLKDAFLLTYCPVCENSVERSGICKACVNVLETAMLDDSAYTFEVDGYKVECRSVFSYEYDQVKTAVLYLKDNPDECVYRYFAAYMAKHIRNLKFDGNTVVTYVPRSNKGLRDKGFDQGELLAKAVCRIIPEISCKKLIKRKGRSTAQKILDAKQRAENVKGKFAAVKTADSPKNIIIIDDVFTTGSSMKECAAVLKSAYPDAEIFCVTAAKTPEYVGIR